MPEEIGATIDNLNDLSETNYGDLKIFSGEWLGDEFDNLTIYISVAWSGWGKVSAARAATRLIGTSFKKKKIDLLIFTGVAGAANSSLKQWDLVVPSALVQHDMDARPLFPKFVVPTLRTDKLNSIEKYSDWSVAILSEAISRGKLQKFGQISRGVIATGDRFITEKGLINMLSDEIIDLCAVEMEGAAVAQVSHQEGIPWLILRVISDSADESAAQTFSEFLQEYSKISWNLVETLMSEIKSII